MITFTSAFKCLNEVAGGKLFSFHDDIITVIDERAKFTFHDALGVPSAEDLSDNQKQFSFSAFYYDTQCQDANLGTKQAIKYYAAQHTPIQICIQQRTRSNWGNRFLVSTEELGTLVSMLYFRAKGYAVQKPLSTYGRWGQGLPGVDDVVAWKSPSLDALLQTKIVSGGFHVSELGHLRSLGINPASDSQQSTAKPELILVEAKSCAAYGLSSGISQLLRAKQENKATGLLICFPTVGHELDAVYKEEIYKRTAPEPIGAMLFNNEGLKHEPGYFFGEAPVTEITAYENQVKRILIGNLYFKELLEFVEQIGVDVHRKGFNEVLRHVVESTQTESFVHKLLSVMGQSLPQRVK